MDVSPWTLPRLSFAFTLSLNRMSVFRDRTCGLLIESERTSAPAQTLCLF